MLTEEVELITAEDNTYAVRASKGLYEVYTVNGGIVPDMLKGRYTEEFRALQDIKEYFKGKVLESYPVRVKAKLKDPKKPGRKPQGPRNNKKKVKDGTSKTDSTVH